MPQFPHGQPVALPLDAGAATSVIAHGTVGRSGLMSEPYVITLRAVGPSG